MERPILRKLRHLAGLTQWEVGRQLGKDQTFVSALEQGRRSPSQQDVVALSIAFDVPVTAIAAALRPQSGEATDPDSDINADPNAQVAAMFLRDLHQRLTPDGTLVVTVFPTGRALLTYSPPAPIRKPQAAGRKCLR